MRLFLRSLAVAIAACTMTARAAAQPVNLKIGIVPFDDPRGQEITETEASLRAYFDGVERNSGDRVHINLVKGNYYQIHQWMRDGLVDGAVVSSFTAHLLTHDKKIWTLPVIEFARADPGVPKVSAMSHGRHLKDPIAALDHCLAQIHASMRGERSTTAQCEFRMVSHLSTTGFVAPLMYIEEQFVRKRGVKAQAEFWTRLLQKTRLELWHDADRAIDESKTIIRFSYAPSTPRRVELLGKNVMPSLNDVLLIRCKAPGCAPREGSAPVTSPAEARWWTDTAKKDLDSLDRTENWSGYVAVTPWIGTEREAFAECLTAVFRPNDETSALGALYDRWYEHGQYAFSIDEVVDVLRFDQIIRNKPRAALVLPGGGVRATYQSVILDYLYKEKIVNAGEQRTKAGQACVAVATPIEPKPDRLVINGIAGTSGGALLGYLASRDDGSRDEILRKLWIVAGDVKTKPLDIFPALGVLRWLSLLLLIAVFAATSAIHLPELNQPPEREVPFWYTTFISIVVAGAPFLIWCNARHDPTYYPYFEGLAFCAVVGVVHIVHSTSARGHKALNKGWLWGGAALIAAGLLLTYALVRSQHAFQGWDLDEGAARWSSGGWAFASVTTLLVVILGLSRLAGRKGTRRDQDRLKGYIEALIALFLLLVLAASIFGIGVIFNQVTPLEMTADYWIWVFLSGVFAAKLIITAARVYHDRPHLMHGVRFLNTPSGSVPFPYTPAIALVAWGFLGIAVWLAFIAPAVYTSHNGEKAFRRAVAAMPPHELVPLIVSMTGLGDAVPGYKEPAYRGDYYAVDKRWCNVADPDDSTTAPLFRLPDDRFRNAVFASGSPFPVYPATRVHAETKEWPGLFVDGGYAHRVPIEAAGLVDAAQILVVENVTRQEAAPAKGVRAGALTANLANTFDLLFERSQAIDAQRRRGAVVATIYADWSPPDPFLMDFRESVINSLWNEAKGDLKGHRVARVESWGQPKESSR